MKSLELNVWTIFATMVLSTQAGPIRRARTTDQMEHRYKNPCGGQRRVNIDIPQLQDNSTAREVTRNLTVEIEPLLQDLSQKFADLERKYLKLDGFGTKRYIHRLNRMVIGIIRQAVKSPLPISPKKTTDGTNKTQTSRTMMAVSTNTNKTHTLANTETINHYANGHVASLDQQHLHDELQVEKVYETMITADADLQPTEIPVSTSANAETALELDTTKFDPAETNEQQSTSVSRVTPSSHFSVTTSVSTNNTNHPTTKPSVTTSSGNITHQEALGDATVTETETEFTIASNSTETIRSNHTDTQNKNNGATIVPMDIFSNTTNSTVNTESNNETMTHLETSKQEDYEKHKVYINRLWRLFRIMAVTSLFTEQIRNYEFLITESLIDNRRRVILNDILEIEKHATTGIEHILCKIKLELLAHGEENVNDFHMDQTNIIPANFRRHDINRAKKLQRTYVMIASLSRLMDFLVADVNNWHEN